MSESNGKNGHAKRDDGLRPDMDDPRPCCARMEHGGWCGLPDGHEGPHDGPPRAAGPIQSASEVIGRCKECCKVVKTDDALCRLPRGHSGDCKG